MILACLWNGGELVAVFSGRPREATLMEFHPAFYVRRLAVRQDIGTHSVPIGRVTANLFIEARKVWICTRNEGENSRDIVAPEVQVFKPEVIRER